MTEKVPRRFAVALGCNLGDRRGYLRSALVHLGPCDALSRVYETLPVGGPPGQGPYLNMVATFSWELAPLEALERCQEIEEELGRVRTIKDGPRTIDLDILLIDDLRLDTSRLVVPHPRMFDRGFVLAPLFDVLPEVVRSEVPTVAVALEHRDGLPGGEVLPGVVRVGPLS